MMENHQLRNDLRNTYNTYAQERESRASDVQDWKIQERSRFLSAIQKEKKKSLLELGAGTGRDSKYFQDQGFEVICIDLSPAMVELCKQKGLTAYVMDMANLDFSDHSFDAVYALNSLLHLSKAEFPKVLHRIDSLLRAEGMVYLGVYGGYEYEGVWENDLYIPKRFFSFFSDESLEQEISQVFDILDFNRVSFEDNNPLHFQSLLLKKRSSPKKAG
jgi:SAM-dependent methyltransferase